MKDIDFDELDRAVSSLMKTVPEDEKEVVTPEDTAPVVTLGGGGTAMADTPATVTATVSDDVPSSTAQNVPPLQSEEDLSQVQEPAPATEESVTSAPTPAVRRGRFMDVMPGSRDAKRPQPAAPASRQGVTLQPTGAPVETEEPAVAEATSSATDALTMPDPLALTDTSSEDMNPDVSMTEPVEVEAESAATTELAEEAAPLSSPFLPDAKVEKRPLGRPAEAAPTVDLAAELSAASNEPLVGEQALTEDAISPNKDAQLPEQPRPAELGSELLSIETSADTVASTPQTTMLEQKPEAAPVAPVSAPTVTESVTARAMAATSIPQQYKVQPTTENSDAPASAIYDTQPLAHPAKKKSGLFILFAIVAIILIGAGGGAAIYYLGLI